MKNKFDIFLGIVTFVVPLGTLLLLIGMLIYSCIPVSSKYIFESNKNSIYYVLNGANPSEINGGGTGFSANIKGKSYIVTNYHICNLNLMMGMPYLIIVTEDLKMVAATIIYVFPNIDVCLLMDLKDSKPLHFSTMKDNYERPLYSIGHSNLEPLALATGLVTEAMDAGNTVIVTSILTYPGNSGSPIFDIYNNVVGIMSMANPETHYGLFISYKAMKAEFDRIQ